MELGKLAMVGITVAIVIIGLTVGVSLFAFQTSGNNTETHLTGITTDRDLLELGLQVPDNWSFAMSDGTILNLDDLNGQIVLVDLMATWCSSCITQNANLQTLYESLSGSLVIISLSVDVSETAAMLEDYKTTKGLPWDHGLDSNSAFATYFSVANIPSLVLIDGDGYFRFYHIGVWSASSISDRVGSIT